MFSGNGRDTSGMELEAYPLTAERLTLVLELELKYKRYVQLMFG